MSFSRRFTPLHPGRSGVGLHRKAPAWMGVAFGWIGYALIVYAVFAVIVLLL